MTLNGGKIYGPKQSGVLYIRAGIKLRPQIDGGGQEMGMRSGTENIPGIIGLSAALDKAQAGRHEESQRLKGLQKQFITLLQAKIPNVLINGSLKYRLPNNIHLTIPGSDNERLIIELDERGIQAAAGSACSASDEDPSHVLRAMGMSDEEARASLRLTIGRQTTLEEVERTVDVLANLCKKD
jgi:cysteine desulfurase